MRGSLPVTRAPDFACSIRATIRHSFFEMLQPAAVSALVETPLPAAVSALVKTSQPIAFAHWLASDLLRPGPAKEFGPRPVQHRSKMPRRRARRGPVQVPGRRHESKGAASSYRSSAQAREHRAYLGAAPGNLEVAHSIDHAPPKAIPDLGGVYAETDGLQSVRCLTSGADRRKDQPSHSVGADQGMVVWWSIGAGVHMSSRTVTQMSRSFGCSRARWSSGSATNSGSAARATPSSFRTAGSVRARAFRRKASANRDAIVSRCSNPRVLLHATVLHVPNVATA